MAFGEQKALAGRDLVFVFLSPMLIWIETKPAGKPACQDAAGIALRCDLSCFV